MAGISGKNGIIKKSSSSIAEGTGWTFNPTSNNPSWASSDTAGYKKRVAGVKDGSGSMQGKYDPADAIFNHLKEGDSVTLRLYINATKYIEIPALIDSLQIEVDMNDGDVVGWSMDFSSNGAWVYTAAL